MYIGPWQEYRLAQWKDVAISTLRAEITKQVRQEYDDNNSVSSQYKKQYVSPLSSEENVSYSRVDLELHHLIMKTHYPPCQEIRQLPRQY